MSSTVSTHCGLYSTLWQHIQNVTTSSAHISPRLECPWPLSGDLALFPVASQGLTFCLELLNEPWTHPSSLSTGKLETETHLDCLAFVPSQSLALPLHLKCLRKAAMASWWHACNFLYLIWVTLHGTLTSNKLSNSWGTFALTWLCLD